MRNEKNQAFSLLELLVVVVILSFLVFVVATSISKYVEKGKQEYDGNLDDELVISGKSFYVDQTDKLPLEVGDGSFITLNELQSMNLISKDFVNAEGESCSKSYVTVEKNQNGEYNYYPCLICGDKRYYEGTNYEKKCDVSMLTSSKCPIYCDQTNKKVSFIRNLDSNKYCYFIDQKESYKGEQKVECSSATEIENALPGTYYGHVISKSPSNNAPTGSNNPKTYNWNGTPSSRDVYFLNSYRSGYPLLRTNGVTNSSDTVPIPSEYNFSLGNTYSSVTISGASKLTKNQMNKWADKTDVFKSGYTGYVPTKGFTALYRNVGKYNGISVDVRETLEDFQTNTTYANNKGLKPFTIFYDKNRIGIELGSVYWVKVRYDFLIAGTSKPITVKGYTTYWDVDCWQGIHLVNGSKGLYAPSVSGVRMSYINGVPYIYDVENKNNKTTSPVYSATEIFEGSSITRVYSFSRPKAETQGASKASKITSSTGGIWNSAIASTAYKQVVSETGKLSTVVNPGDTLTYEITYINGKEGAVSAKVEDILDQGLQYVPGSSNKEEPTIKHLTDGRTKLTWNLPNAATYATNTLKYNVTVLSNANKTVKNNAVVTLGNMKIYTHQAENSVITEDKDNCICTIK